MRKLFELFLSFFRPVPKDVVNTGYMTDLSNPAPRRYNVTRKDWNEYANRLGRLRTDTRRRLDLGREFRHRHNDYTWYVNGMLLIERSDYPEFAIIKKQHNWALRELYKA